MSSQNLDTNINVDFNELNKYFSEYIEGINFDNAINNRNTDVNNSVNNDNKVNNQCRNVSQCRNVCQNCGGNKFVEDHSQGIVVCTNRTCGQVFESLFDNNPEWKQYDDDDKSGARCSQPVNVLLPQSSLGTSIGGYGKNRIKILHSWNQMPYKERSLNNEFKKIHEICQKSDILKCVEDDTKIMYKMVSECKHVTGKNKGKFVITRGINRKSIIAACLFFACIRKGVTRTSKEIALMCGIKEMEMNKGCKNLQKLFKIKNKSKKQVMDMGTSKPEHFIRRYCNELKIKNQYIDEALKIAINVEKLNIASGHTPYSSAAASILLMAELNNLNYITKKKLASEFDISDGTIYKTYKELEPYKYVLTNNETTDEILKQIKKDSVQQEVPPEVLERMQKFGVQQDTKQGNKSVKQNVKFANVIDDADDDSDLEIELDESFSDDGDFDIGSDSDDEFVEELDDPEQIEKFNAKIASDLKGKFIEINKLLKNKSVKDIKKDIEALQSSHELIKSIKRDMDQFACNLY